MAKVRNGFVTNSSSSSFIVAFDDVPATAEELKDVLFPNGQERISCSYIDTCRSCMEAAERVFNDLAGQKPNDTKAIEEAFRGFEGRGDGAPKYDDYIGRGMNYSSPEYRKAMDAYNEACEKYTKAQVRRFMKDNMNRQVFVFRYADDGGEADLEHGDLFDQVPHVRVSNH
jgi:hypothetical protein